MFNVHSLHIGQVSFLPRVTNDRLSKLRYKSNIRRKTTSKIPKPRQPTSTVGLFDMLNQALSEFAHTEHLDPNFVESVDQSIANKKSNPGSIDPVIFCFSSSLPNSQDDNVSKYVELLKTRYIKSISQIFCARATDFWRFHRFIAPHAAKSPEIFEFLCLLAQNASEKKSADACCAFYEECV